MGRHDFKKFPELTNSQLQFYYWDSPHKQILESFEGEVINVHDGDTIRVRMHERPFDFPIRVAHINAPELNEEGGILSRDWLRSRILNQKVMIIIDSKNRVGKFGRLIGDIMIGGDLISEASLREGRALPFGVAKEGEIPTLEAMLK